MGVIVDENRFTRLETRVDEIKDDVAEVKAEQKILNNSVVNLSEDMKEHIQVVRDHVTGDDKIITEIQPLLQVLPHLTEVVEEYKIEKAIREKRKEALKMWAMRLGIPSVILGMAGAIVKIWTSF